MAVFVEQEIIAFSLKCTSLEKLLAAINENECAEIAGESLSDMILDLKVCVDGLLDSNNFTYSLGAVLNSVNSSLEAIETTTSQLQTILVPYGFVGHAQEQLVATKAPKVIDEPLNEPPASWLTPPPAIAKEVVDVATPTLESLGLSQNAMELFGSITPTSQLLRSTGDSVSTPALHTIKKAVHLRDSFSSVASPALQTSICASIPKITAYEYDALDDFVIHQLDFDEINEGVDLVNEILTDKQLLNPNYQVSSSISVHEIENIGIQPRHKALLLALLQLKRVSPDGVAADGSKSYRVVA